MRQGLIGGIIGLVLGVGAVLAVGFIADDDAAAPALCSLTTAFADRYGERALSDERSFDQEPLERLNLILSIREKAC